MAKVTGELYLFTLVINIFKEVIFSNNEKISVLISEQRLLEKQHVIQ